MRYQPFLFNAATCFLFLTPKSIANPHKCCEAPGGATVPKILVSLPFLTKSNVLELVYFLQNLAVVAKLRIQSLDAYPDLSRNLA